MDTFTPISGFILAVAAAFLGGYLVRFLRLPPMVGYLLAGIVLAPFATALLTEGIQIQALAELGVAFLLFQAGTQFPISEIKKMPWSVLIGPAVQLLLMVPLVALAYALTDWPLSKISLIAIVIYLSSTAATIMILNARNESESTHGRTAIAFSLVQNVALVLAVIYLTAFSSSTEQGLMSLGITGAKSVAFLVVVYYVGARLAPRLLNRLTANSQELFVIGGVFFAIGTGYLAHHMGLSLSIGTFLAGVVVAGSAMGRRMRQDLSPISDLFVIFFFLSLGLLLDVSYVVSNIPIVALFLASIIIGKVGILALVFSFFKSSRKDALPTALVLGQIGEEAFLVVYLAMTHGIMSAEMFSLVVAGAVISIALNPILVQYAPIFSKAPQGLPALLKGLKESLKALPGLGLRKHAIVCGYGSLGQKVAQTLALNGVSFVVIEQDASRLAALKQNGFHFIEGDPTSAHVLNRANIADARSLVVTLPDPLMSDRVIQQAKGLQPDLGVVTIHPSYDDRLGLSNYVLRHEGISSNILKKLLAAAKAGFPNKTYAFVEPY
ncbi:MAG: hypothetical protein FJ320_09275 [SAR202 cluster bacterium]|nr:hypothetical protein [SAR202 cluster bacterium]